MDLLWNEGRALPSPGPGTRRHRNAGPCEQPRESSTQRRDQERQGLVRCRGPPGPLRTPQLHGMKMSALHSLIFWGNQVRRLCASVVTQTFQPAAGGLRPARFASPFSGNEIQEGSRVERPGLCRQPVLSWPLGTAPLSPSCAGARLLTSLNVRCFLCKRELRYLPRALLECGGRGSPAGAAWAPRKSHFLPRCSATEERPSKSSRRGG